MTFGVKEESIWAAIEDTYNQEEAIVAADVIETENLVANPTESIKIIERNIIQNSLAPKKHRVAASLFGFTLDVEMKGNNAAGTSPRIGRLLRACACTETIVPATSVTWTPESDTSLHDSLTMFYKEGPNLRRVTGVRGNAAGNVDSGGRLMISFTFIGHISAEAEAAAPAETPEGTEPPIFQGANFQSGGFAADIGKLAFDLGNTMSIVPSPNSPDSFGVIRVGARKVVGSFDPEAQGIGTKDYIGELRNNADFAIQTGVLGSDAGNRIAVSLPECRFTNAQPGDREAQRIYEMSYGAYPTVAGDDDIAIQVT